MAKYAFFHFLSLSILSFFHLFTQAQSIRLQQEVKEKETKLEQAYSRLEAGDPPDEETAKEWLKLLQRSKLVNGPLKQTVRKVYFAIIKNITNLLFE